MLDWEQVRARANGDGEFRIHARFWNSRIRLRIGDRRYQIVVDSGEIVSIDRWYRGTACDLAIMAPEEDWEAMLESVPRPFYQDLYPATLHHGFDVAGDIGHYCAYYPAIRRLVEVMREVRNGSEEPSAGECSPTADAQGSGGRSSVAGNVLPRKPAA